MKYLRFVLFYVIIVQGCAPFNSSLLDSRVKIDVDSIKKFNGIYKNISIDSIDNKKPSLWLCFKDKYYGNNWYETKVSLKFINEHKVTVELIDKNGDILKRKIIHGELNDGYFYPRRNFMFYPIFPIAFGYVNKHSRFCLKDNYLYIDKSSNIWLIVWIGGACEQKEISFKCEKIE